MNGIGHLCNLQARKSDFWVDVTSGQGGSGCILQPRAPWGESGRMPRDLRRDLLAAWSGLVAAPWQAFVTLTYTKQPWCEEKCLKDWKAFLWEWQFEQAARLGLAWKEPKPPKLDGYGRVIGERTRYGGPWVCRYRSRKPDALPVWIVGAEPHRNERLHMHALVSFGELLGEAHRTLGWELWTRGKHRGRGAIARIEPPRSQDQVASYVSKYIVKDGELTWSDTFGQYVKRHQGLET